MKIETLFDKDTFTLTHIVFDETTKDAIIIDPVLDYDPASSGISFTQLQLYRDFIDKNKLNLKLVLESHAHADHVTASHYIKEYYPDVKIGISENIKIVQETFKNLFNIDFLKTDGSQFDLLIKHNQEIEAGSIKIKALATPGHTPACMSFLIEDNVFTGDALFMPDFGSGRCDFPAGSAEDLYHSIHDVLYALPDETKAYVGHDYQPGGRELAYMTTIGQSKSNNIQLKEHTSKEEFVNFRTTRDKQLKAPRLLLPSIQINAAAGTLPPAEDNGMSYIKLPLKITE